MPTAFISYSRRDADVAERVRASLEEQDVEVWIDQEDIPPAAVWQEQIHAAIDAQDVVVMLLSAEWAASRVCKMEASRAFESGKQVVPVLAAEVDPDELDPRVGRLNWVLLRPDDDFDAGVEQLLSAVRTDLEWSGLHARLLAQARTWSDSGRATSHLLRGRPLEYAELELAVERPAGQPQPIELQRSFVQASRSHRSTFLRRVLVGVVAALAAAIALGIVALLARNESDRQRAVAEEQATIALAGQLAAQSAVEVERDLVSGLLVAAAAYATDPTDDHRLGIANALAPFADVVDIHREDLQPLAVVPTPTGVTVIHDGGLLALDPEVDATPTDRVEFGWDTAGQVLEVVRGSTDRTAVVLRSGPEPRAIIVDLPSATIRWERTLEGFVGAEVLDEDASVVLVDATGIVRYDAATGERMGPVDRRDVPFGDRSVRGDLMAVGDGDVRSVATGASLVRLEPEFRIDTPAPFDSIHAIRSLEFDPAGAVLAIGGNDGSVWFGDPERAAVSGFGEPVHGGDGVAVPVVDLAFASTGDQMFSLGADGTVARWATGRGVGFELMAVRPSVNGWAAEALAVTDRHLVIATERGVIVRTLAPVGLLADVVGAWPAPAFVGAADGRALYIDADSGQLTSSDGPLNVATTRAVVAADVRDGVVAVLQRRDDGSLELVVADDDGRRTRDVDDDAAGAVSIGREAILVVGACSVEIIDLELTTLASWSSPCEIGSNLSGNLVDDDIPLIRRSLQVQIGEPSDARFLDGLDALPFGLGSWLVADDGRVQRVAPGPGTSTSWADGAFERLEFNSSGDAVVGVGRELAVWNRLSARQLLRVPLAELPFPCRRCDVSADAQLTRIDVIGVAGITADETMHLAYDLSIESLLAAVCEIADRDLTDEEWQRYEVGDRPPPTFCSDRSRVSPSLPG